MNMQPDQPQTPPQKLIDFNLELEALCKKYQYEVVPVIEFIGDPAHPGVIRGQQAQIKVFDKSPKDEAVAINQQGPADQPADTTAAHVDNPKVN